MIVCTALECQTTAGCRCACRSDMTAHWPLVLGPSRSDVDRAFAAGRLAGIREAAEVIQAFVSIPADGTMTDDMVRGIAMGASYCAVQNQVAILALAEGRDEVTAQERSVLRLVGCAPVAVGSCEPEMSALSDLGYVEKFTEHVGLEDRPTWRITAAGRAALASSKEKP